ncbi:GPO family capsid scaffolding protein [Caballeronia sp. LZ001]|uniref:GPO family capsid scaffolding protein n=3 Tax=Caballeronia TaxID=1827195 RepID=UPI002856A6D3|nr:GPO family capsid scaffolding protein [Caballeronia sp. LZ001]MDR5801908.1 GPO family capsid scaffolding protein [Caballeronia sp. LZ001]MDR5805273.1 GPO family capsid scaffolding protein [Caballeronia sp. LZ001]
MPLNWKRVATQGATTDGREITRQQIEDMASTYDPKTKIGARVFCEHIRGMAPDSPFRAFGDVRALKAEAVEDGKLALFAQIDPTDDLKAMAKSRQKIYSSVEIDTNFGGSGKAYLVGLGVTDSPASFGTDVLTFAQQHPDHFRSKKQRPENVFSASVEIDTDFGEADQAGNASGASGAPDPVTFFGNVLAKLGFSAQSSGGAQVGDAVSPSNSPANSPAAGSGKGAPQTFTAEQLAQAFHQAQREAQGEAADKAVTERLDRFEQQFSDFVKKMESVQFSAPRPPVTGGGGTGGTGELTDC